MKKTCSISTALSVIVILTCLSTHAQDIKTQLLAQAPSTLLDTVKEDPANNVIQVVFLKADLDGSGRFQYIIAGYSLSRADAGPGLYLRVFKQDKIGLKLVGQQEDDNLHGDYSAHMELIDINGDGIPEIDLSGTDASGKNIDHDYFAWTGSSLHSLFDEENEGVTGDASLMDLDGDGRLELIIRPAPDDTDRTFLVYKFNGTDFTLSQKLDHDPTGLVAADGTVQSVHPGLAVLYPEEFSLEAIKKANRKDNDDKGHADKDDEQGRVNVIIGELKNIQGKSASVEQIDPATIQLGRGLHPIRSKIRSSDDDKKHAIRQVLELEFSRREFLRQLSHVKLTGPLVAGDKVPVELTGKLKDGTGVFGGLTAHVKGDEDRRASR